MSSPRLDMIGIITADLTRSLAFYRALGVPVPDGAESGGHVEATLPNGLRLAWDTLDVIRSFDPEFEISGGGHPLSLAFRVDSPAEVDATYTRMTSEYRGHKPPWDAPWGQRYATVLDPDGNSIDLFADQSSSS